MAGRRASSSSVWISSFSSAWRGMVVVIIWQTKFGGVPLLLGFSPCPLLSLLTWKEEEDAATAADSSWRFVFFCTGFFSFSISSSSGAAACKTLIRCLGGGWTCGSLHSSGTLFLLLLVWSKVLLFASCWVLVLIAAAAAPPPFATVACNFSSCLEVMPYRHTTRKEVQRKFWGCCCSGYSLLMQQQHSSSSLTIVEQFEYRLKERKK